MLDSLWAVHRKPSSKKVNQNKKMAWKWYDSKIIKIEDESPTTKRFWVEVEEVEQIDFEAGQFVTMDLPIHEKRLKRWRSYSIANEPDGTNILEFCIVYLEGGGASEYLFKEATIGTPIRFKGPSGTFVLPKEIKNDLVLICTGTGIAPFRSMLFDLHKNKKAHRQIHLIFGTRYENGILYQEELEKMQSKIDGFDYSVALSRVDEMPENNTPTNYYKGYLHQIYQEKHAVVRPDIDFYICGWSNMIDETVAKLTVEMGYDKSQVHYELYG